MFCQKGEKNKSSIKQYKVNIVNHFCLLGKGNTEIARKLKVGEFWEWLWWNLIVVHWKRPSPSRPLGRKGPPVEYRRATVDAVTVAAQRLGLQVKNTPRLLLHQPMKEFSAFCFRKIFTWFRWGASICQLPSSNF